MYRLSDLSAHPARSGRDATGASTAASRTRPRAGTAQSVGGSYIFHGRLHRRRRHAERRLYHIPGIDGEETQHPHRRQADQDQRQGRVSARRGFIDAIRFWGGVTDYKHNEIGLADPADLTSDGVRQTFTNKEQEGRIEVKLTPFNLRFAS